MGSPLTPEERFAALLSALGGVEVAGGVSDRDARRIAAWGFTLGMEEAARLVKGHKFTSRMVRPATDGYVMQIDGVATMRALRAILLGKEPGG